MVRYALAVACLLASAAFAQEPQFEVATIKPAAPATPAGRTSSDRPTVSYRNTTLKNALAKAFQVTSGNQIKGPSWVLTERYDIVAKAPSNTPPERIPRMLQLLLQDRFQLAIHHEIIELPAFALVIGKTPSTLIPSRGADQMGSGSILTPGHRYMKHMTMAALAQFLSQVLQTSVLDKTGLEGAYDFTLDQSQEELMRDSAPSIFTVVQELGLSLESNGKMPFDVIVVDQGNPVPLEN